MRYISYPWRLLRMVYYKLRIGCFGWRSIMIHPLHLDGCKNIFIGDRCTIGYKTWLAAVPKTGRNVRLTIGDRCAIGNFNHIYATRSVVLHNDVLTADKVYISDNLHGYEDIGTPIWAQPIMQNGEVEIGEGSWLGENVCVLGAKIGKHCVIGANSVVTKDIPDYSVAVGAPAKVIKHYNFDENEWKKIDNAVVDDVYGGGISYVWHKATFKRYNITDVILHPLLLTPECIELGEHVYIGHHARIQGIKSYGDDIFNPRIVLDDGVSIEQNLHLTCANFVKIGRNTAIAANVTITDIHHPYEDVSKSIERQALIVKDVNIGEDCKIYNNVVILPGVQIGKHVTIGANSVVVRNIPDYSVAVGNPAKVVKQYDFESNKWKRINND